jgi:hypothetical protein
VFAQKYLGLELTGLLDRSIENLRFFVHFVLNWAFFYWISLLVSAITYVTTLALSFFTAIVPYWPHIAVPVWIKDLGLASVILVRAFECASSIYPPIERDKYRLGTTEEQTRATTIAQGKIWFPIHAATAVLIRPIYKIRNFLTKNALRFLPDLKELGFAKDYLRDFVTSALNILVQGALMAGFIRLVGYLTIAIPARRVESPWITSSTRMLVYFSAAMICAIAVTIFTFWLNDLLLRPLCRGDLWIQLPSEIADFMCKPARSE